MIWSGQWKMEPSWVITKLNTLDTRDSDPSKKQKYKKHEKSKKRGKKREISFLSATNNSITI